MFVVFGDDFRYVNAHQNYLNMDNMIEYMNANFNDTYIFKYSTPSDYVDALAKHNVSWPTKYDDMFPYSDNPDAYWTGYFTSRANDKEYIRRASHNLHASTQLFSEKIISQTIQDTEIASILNAKDSMLNELGINQHHDAVTGTAKQHVADDYAYRLYTALETNNVVYNEAVAEKVQAFSGFGSHDPWAQCFQTNTTYVDCPIANQDLTNNFSMHVAIHNPSSLDFSTARIAVPNANYSVEAFDTDKQIFKLVESNIICAADKLIGEVPVDSCFLAVNHTTAARDISLLKVNYVVAEPKQAQPLNVGNSIESKDIKLGFAGFATGESMLQFEFINKKTAQKELLRVSIGNWRSQRWYNEFTDTDSQNSGDYIFRPETGQYEPDVYSNYTMNATFMTGPVDSEMTFYFSN